ncbi:hypothetical protein BBJ28_00008502 [Nothophytophthora sp. Chile5]|nr:hypothetical protein BBJ28_00008502 [Nothophytophthora sp. Chile5]
MATSTRHALIVGGSAGIGLGVALSVAPLHAPQASFMHIYPGWVNTDLLKSFPWYIRLPVNAISALFATTIETCGERMTLALTKDEFAVGWKLLDERAEEVPKTKFHTDELKDLVWDYTIQTIDDALKK